MKKFISFLFLSITLIAFVYFYPVRNFAMSLCAGDISNGVNILNVAVAEDLTRTHSGGNVKVAVTLVNVKDLTSMGIKEELAFEISLNTHSVNLSAYQMEKISFLRDEEGNEYKAESWDSLSESSHHRSGVLKFSNLDEKGNFIITPSSKSIELVIRELAGIEERVFRWDIPE